MKRFAMTTLLLGALAVVFSAQPTKAQVSVNVSIGGFYDELSPYGSWVDCSYGQCWVPERVSADWQPYTNGEWVYTEYGWTWMSSDPWGGNPYHYGTWTSLDRYGWSWVPGTVWAPAWVTWSYGNNYVGWAPLPPTVVFGASGYSGRAVVVSSTQYVFVPMNRFVGSNVTSVRIAAQQNATIFRQTTPLTRFAVSGGTIRNTGIPVATIQRAAGVRIETRSISVAHTTPHSMSATAGNRGRVSIVAPAREVRAAVAAKPHAVSRSAGPSDDKDHKAKVSKDSGHARTESRQGSTVQSAPLKHQEQAGPKTRETSHGQPQGQAAQGSSTHRQDSSHAPAHVEARSSQPRREAATGQQQKPRPVQAQAAQGAPPNQGKEHAKPVVKEKDKDKNEEKH